jgi:RNA exonuclease 1
MGTAKSGDSELIRITLVDYFSSAILIDSLVYPNVEMLHYNTRFSGVTRKDMEIARSTNRCIRGRDNARFAVWRFVGPKTVVIGHSANNDLSALRWIHPVVVDTFSILSAHRNATREKAADDKKDNNQPAVPKPGGTANGAKPKRRKGCGELSLKALAKERLGREIQMAGNRGHDSLEDAIAARDLVHWIITNGI